MDIRQFYKERVIPARTEIKHGGKRLILVKPLSFSQKGEVIAFPALGILTNMSELENIEAKIIERFDNLQGLAARDKLEIEEEKIWNKICEIFDLDAYWQDLSEPPRTIARLLKVKSNYALIRWITGEQVELKGSCLKDLEQVKEGEWFEADVIEDKSEIINFANLVLRLELSEV